MNRLELIKQGIENLSEEDFNKRFGDLIKKEKYFIPKEDEFYYLVDEEGCVSERLKHDKYTTNIHLINNKLFKTRKEAEFQRDKQQFLLQMERDFLDNSDEIDWGNEYQKKYYFYISHKNGTIYTEHYFSFQEQCYHTTNIEWLKEYIKDNEENIKKYHFNIK